jgi:hypothetical protein
MSLVKPVDDRTHQIAILYGKHIRALRIFLSTGSSSSRGDSDDDDCFSSDDDDCFSSIDVFLLCPETRYIAFYHYHAHFGAPEQVSGYIRALIPRTPHFMQLERLDTLGIHFLQEDYWWRMEQIDAISLQIQAILQSERASYIKRFALSIPTLRVLVRELLRTKLESLEHLSIHTSPMPHLFYDNPGPEVFDWSTYHKLTTLKLSRFRRENRIYSFKIPEIVQKCPSLQEIFISDIGLEGGWDVERRQEGWSYLPNEWWNQRKPLRLLHLEAALNITVYFLGLIPVEEVRLVLRGSRINFKFLMEDEEMFPYLRWLHVEKLASSPTARFSGREEREDYLSEVCSRRDINLNVVTIGDRGAPIHKLWEAPSGT